MLSSVYPSSFQLLISINVLALIIVGGMGSLPGVVLGVDRADRAARIAAGVRRVSLSVLWRGADRDDALEAGRAVALATCGGGSCTRDEAAVLDEGADLLPAEPR